MLTLRTIFVVAALFGATIFVHELGHFLVARRLGLIAEVFSIGFGPALWKRKRKGVLYKIGVIPCGGYVALPQMDPTLLEGGAPAEGKPAGEPPAPPPPRVAPWKKILVALAGAGGNLLFAMLLAWVIFWIGKPATPDERSAGIGFVEPESAAAEAGLRAGDTIVRANGKTVENWLDLATALTLEARDEVELEVVSPDGARRVVTVPCDGGELGVRRPAGISGVNIPRVWEVEPDSPAAAIGLRRGDTLLAFAGEKIYSREHLAHKVNEYRDREALLTFRRDGETLETMVRPAYDEAAGRARIGIRFDLVGGVDYDQVVYPRPGYQLRTHAGQIFRFLRALTNRKQAGAAAGAVGGPLSILMMYWNMAWSSVRMALWFTVFFNVNLAILNLLPIPVLDGGHILFSTYEWIARRPAPRRLVQFAHHAFAALLIALFVFLLYRDTRLWFWPRRAPSEPTPPAPAAEQAAE